MNTSQSVGVGQENDARSGGTRNGMDGSQRETGGSGGAGLTASQVAEGNAQASAPGNAQAGHTGEVESSDVENSNIAATTRGAQDTRSRQAGGELGARETGANQGPGDLSPASRQ